MVDITIKGTESGNNAKVTSRGELVTGPLEFSTAVFKSLTVDDAPVNFFKPRAGERLVITALIIQTDRNVVTTGVTVDIYEASADDSGTIDTQLIQFDMGRQDTIIITGINSIITEGKFINAKASDSNVLITISGYFVPS